jgi:hypothetical protein
VFAPQSKLCSKEEPSVWVLFDIRIPDVTERFSRERAAWGEYADVEMFDLNHPVLIVRPGGARRMAA